MAITCDINLGSHREVLLYRGKPLLDTDINDSVMSVWDVQDAMIDVQITVNSD